MIWFLSVGKKESQWFINHYKHSTHRFVFSDYSRVRLCVQSCNHYNLIVKFSISIITTKLWESNYSEYQQYLFNRIYEYKENNVTPIGYRKISKIFNDECLKTPRNRKFTCSKVHSINRKDIIEIGDIFIVNKTHK